MTKTHNSQLDLQPAEIIAKISSGRFDKNDLLLFGHLSLSHFRYSPLYSHLLSLWNDQQSTPGKVRYFTFSLVEDNDRVQSVIKERFGDFKYAWICHDKDQTVELSHWHYYLEFENPRGFVGVANDLELPVTMLEKVYSKKGILQYLTHENDPNKYHYDVSDIFSNFDIQSEIDKSSDFDPWQEYQDYWAMKNGDLSVRDWFNKYGFMLRNVKNINQRTQLYDRLGSQSSRGNGRACPRSEFSVLTPVQTSLRGLQPDAIQYLDKGHLVDICQPTSKPLKPISKKDYRKPNPRADLV